MPAIARMVASSPRKCASTPNMAGPLISPNIGKTDNHRNFAKRLVSGGAPGFGHDHRKGVAKGKTDKDIGTDRSAVLPVVTATVRRRPAITSGTARRRCGAINDASLSPRNRDRVIATLNSRTARPASAKGSCIDR